MWKHWVVRATAPQEPFRNFESARWFWTKLGKVFPEMLAAVLMPNHLHLILPVSARKSKQGERDPSLFKLTGLLGTVSQEVGQRNLWQAIPPPAEIPDLHHLRRQVRYVALNPCRKGLCADPMEWYWSTYREVLGASIERRESAGNLARVLGESRKNFEVRFHSYVSGDPSVKVTGTPLPTRAVPKERWAEQSIGEILGAAAAALRVSPADAQRKGPLRSLFVHLANRHGWRRTSLLAEICQIGPRAVRFILSQAPPAGIEAAELCLGDRRLRLDDPLFYLKAVGAKGEGEGPSRPNIR